VNWYSISHSQRLSEEFIEEFQDKVYWNDISYYQQLSEDFIKEFKDKVYWNCISYSQKLSERFIKEFQDKVNWAYISKYQKLSEDFIKEFKNKVDWGYISEYQKLSENFRKVFNLSLPQNSWLYTTKEEKLEYLKKINIYEIINDEYIIAYKSIRLDNYSVFNFQYKYEVGNIYESNCNCDLNNNNSFGLSAWTKEKALEYYDEGKLLKIKINIEDIGAITKENKIRCFKLEVLEELIN